MTRTVRNLTIALAGLLAALTFSLLPVTAQTMPDDQPVPVDPAFTEDLKGYLVNVTVKDADGIAQANISVTLDSTSVQTDPTGIASFQDVQAGDHQLSVNGQTSTVTVVNGDKGVIQEFPVILNADDDGFLSDGARTGLVILLLLIIAGIFIVKPMMRKKGKKASTHESKSTNGLSDEQRAKLLKPNPPKADTVIHPDDKK